MVDAQKNGFPSSYKKLFVHTTSSRLAPLDVHHIGQEVFTGIKDGICVSRGV